MCLELIYAKMFRLFVLFGYIISTKAVIVNRQLFDSPCPDTFQYRRDQSGQLYGDVGVYSLDENIVQLNVELSIGNQVNNYNGHIELAYPKEEILDGIRRRRPINYKVFFPRWENVPPRVTKIVVNGQTVCSGPRIPIGRWVPVLTTINLQHTLTLTLTPLQSENKPFVPTTKPDNNPFLPWAGEDPSTKPENNDFLKWVNGKGNNGDPFVARFTSTTTTQKPIISNAIPAAGNWVFSKNPFFNGNALGPTVPQEVPDLTSRDTTSPPARPIPAPDSAPSGICGKTVVPNPLIVNGNSVPRGAFPWLAAMFGVISTGLEYKCSGSLVSKKHVVTAAHCVEQGRTKLRADKILFVLGKLNVQKWTQLDGVKMIEASDVMVHPDYVPMTSDADIAVAVLSEEVQFSTFIRPICLWSESDDIDDIVAEKGKVVGWGKDEFGNLATEEPKQVTLPIVSQEQCLLSSELFRHVTSPRTFCAGSRNNDGPCNGDSGSGFVMNRNGRWVLRGVVSISTYDPIGKSCDLSNYVVFTDASKFRTWLFSIIY